MKKLLILILSLIIGTAAFTQETDSTYWHREVDVNGMLVTYYFCKTDAQFNNTFKGIVKKQLGIEYDFHEPNWSSIQSSWISEEGIKKNFPKYYKYISESGTDLNWDNYKYCWFIQNINDMYFIGLAKRINGTVYVSYNIKYGYWQYSYTTETLAGFESLL